MMTTWIGAAILGISGLAVGAGFYRWVRRVLQDVSDMEQDSDERSAHTDNGQCRLLIWLLAFGTAALFLTVGGRYGWSTETLVGVVLGSFLLPLAVIDWKTMLLPDALTFSLLGMMAVLRWWFGPEPWLWYLIGGGLGAGMLLLLVWLSPVLFGKEGMGMGDVKLMAGIGMATGPDGAVLTLFVASLTGIVFGILYRRSVSRRRNDVTEDGAFPFGPALAFGGLFAFLFGDTLWQLYGSLLA